MRSLLLDQTTWDLCLDVAGNIAIASDPYALAQDVACAARTFAGEVYYDTTLGVPFFDQILGQYPPIGVMKQRFVEAAMSVRDVASAVCYFDAIDGRRLTGQIQVRDARGATVLAAF